MTCTICKKDKLDSDREPWITPDGDVIQVARTIEPFALVDTSIGEFDICDSCYRGGLPAFFTVQDAAEIHYQFGLEYRDRQQFELSVHALMRARALSETADILAALAYSEAELGHRELAVRHYRRALEIDPEHFMSRHNLEKIHPSRAG